MEPDAKLISASKMECHQEKDAKNKTVFCLVLFKGNGVFYFLLKVHTKSERKAPSSTRV